MPVITARYTSHDDARAAATALERGGIDAGAISVHTETPVGDDAWDADLEATGDVGARAALGGALGAAAGAAIALIAVAIIGPDPLALSLIIAGLGGAIAGALLGGFWSGAGELPVQTESFDTYGPDHGLATVTAQVPDDAVAAVRDELTASGASAVSVDHDTPQT